MKTPDSATCSWRVFSTGKLTSDLSGQLGGRAQAVLVRPFLDGVPQPCRRDPGRRHSEGPGRSSGRQGYLLVPDIVFALAVDVASIEVALHSGPVIGRRLPQLRTVLLPPRSFARKNEKWPQLNGSYGHNWILIYKCALRD